MRGPGAFGLYASVFRDFHLTERLRLQFRAEAFGVTNSHRFANPPSDGSIIALTGFTEITSSTGERELRFALKLFF